MLVIFLALIIGPVVVRQYINNLPSIPQNLMQPTGQNNNDTSGRITGSFLPGLNFGNTGAAATGGGGGAAATNTATSTGSNSDPFSFGGGGGGGGGGGRFVRW
jgi:hypothetical protein